jgi:DNA repair protein RadA/Sms
VVSAREGHALPDGTIAVGEVGLAGDLRPVVGLERRLSEAARLGFTHAVVPAGAAASGGGVVPAGMRVTRVSSLREAALVATGGA